MNNVISETLDSKNPDTEVGYIVQRAPDVFDLDCDS